MAQGLQPSTALILFTLPGSQVLHLVHPVLCSGTEHLPCFVGRRVIPGKAGLGNMPRVGSCQHWQRPETWWDRSLHSFLGVERSGEPEPKVSACGMAAEAWVFVAWRGAASCGAPALARPNFKGNRRSGNVQKALGGKHVEVREVLLLRLASLSIVPFSASRHTVFGASQTAMPNAH